MTAMDIAACVATGCGGPAPTATAPAPSASTAAAATAAPTLPGTPGHFDNGEFSFDYPADWPVRSAGYDFQVEYVLAVLGDATWTGEGCRKGAAGSCSDSIVAAPGQVLVKVYRWWGGPFVPCSGENKANETFGSLAVRRLPGPPITWEIRIPGNEFGQNNNIFVSVTTDDPAQLARAEALTASFRWLNPSIAGTCDTFDLPSRS